MIADELFSVTSDVLAFILGEVNEYIKVTCDKLMPFYQKLFNTVFVSGFIPESWLIGCIVPIYKNKGDTEDPQNYRPITLLSC